jgi:HPt (histidine-containing phosphotransfer) domain-containing protein
VALPPGSIVAVVEQGPLDPAAIARLRALSTPSEPDLLRELVEIFARDANAGLVSLVEAVQTGEPKMIADHAHKLVSGCENVGARRMAQYCRDLEDAARGSQPGGDYSSHLARIRREFTSVIDALGELTPRESQRELESGREDAVGVLLPGSRRSVVRELKAGGEGEEVRDAHGELRERVN